VTFEGEYFRVRNVRCIPKPDPPPPIMIGGGGEKLTLKAVARHADWWNLAWEGLSPYKHKLDALRHHCSRIGRDSKEIVKTLLGAVVIAETDEKAQKIAKESHFNRFQYTFASLAHFIGTTETVKNKNKRVRRHRRRTLHPSFSTHSQTGYSSIVRRGDHP